MGGVRESNPSVYDSCPPPKPQPLPMPSIPAGLLLTAGWLVIPAGLEFASLPYVPAYYWQLWLQAYCSPACCLAVTGACLIIPAGLWSAALLPKLT